MPTENISLSGILDAIQRLDKRFNALDEKFTGKFVALDDTIQRLDDKFIGKFIAQDNAMHRLDEKFTGLFIALDDTIQRLDDKFIGKFIALDEKLTQAIERSQNEIIEVIRDVVQTTSDKLDGHEQRLVKIEDTIFPAKRLGKPTSTPS